MKEWYRFDARSLVLAGFLVVAPQFGCAEDFGATRIPPSFRYYTYSHGRIVHQREVRRGDRVYDALVSFLRGHRTGWLPDANTYAPLLYFTSSYLTVNCRDLNVVINYKDEKSGRWKQISNRAAECTKWIAK